MNRLANGIQQSALIPVRMRKWLLRFSGIKVGYRTKIFPDTFFGSSRCEIGNYCFISIRCFIDGSEWVRVKDGVFLAPGVQILTSTHEIGPSDHRAGPLKAAPVTVGKGSWLALHASFCRA